MLTRVALLRFVHERIQFDSIDPELVVADVSTGFAFAILLPLALPPIYSLLNAVDSLAQEEKKEINDTK